MMDQLVNPMNNGAPVEARDNHKPRSDSADKSGFRDTLSSVKSKGEQGAHDDADLDRAEAGDEAVDDGDDAAQQADRANRQRRLELLAKAASTLSAQDLKRSKDALAVDRATLPKSSDQIDAMNSSDIAALLKEAIGVEDGISVDDLLADMPKLDPALEGDASIADIVSNFLVSAEVASAAAGLDKDSKLDAKREERGADKLTGKNADVGLGATRDAFLGSDSEGGLDFGGDSEATYRFNSVRGEGLRSLDMAVRNQDGKIDFEVKEAGGRITENVTVLESRRFLGLATPTNATALASLIASDSDWMNALRPESALLNAATQSSTGKVVHSLKLLLTPQDLGSVTVSLRMVGEELKVHMSVENQNAYRRLQEDNRSMMDALKAHGITVDQITISVSAAEKGEQTGGQNNGQSGNPYINGDNESGKGASARSRQGQSEQSGGTDGQQNSDIDHDADGRTGGVYL